MHSRNFDLSVPAVNGEVGICSVFNQSKVNKALITLHACPFLNIYGVYSSLGQGEKLHSLTCNPAKALRWAHCYEPVNKVILEAQVCFRSYTTLHKHFGCNFVAMVSQLFDENAVLCCLEPGSVWYQWKLFRSATI